MNRAVAKLVSAAALLFVAGCSQDVTTDDGAESGDDALVNGHAGVTADFPSVIYLKSGCTAAKVAKKPILTAAHCVVDPSSADIKFGPTAPIGYTQDPAKGFVDAPVAAVHVHPTWLKGCEDTYCAGSAQTAKMDAADVAIIELVDDIVDVKIVPIAAEPLATGDVVTVVGFGCTAGVLTADDRAHPSLKYAQTHIVPTTNALHAGSYITDADVAQVSGIYSMTAGPGASGAKAGLCPGDSGGPLFAKRNGKVGVVGVNSNYTLAPDTQDTVGLPITNWHTRLDDASRHQIGPWLRSVGVPTI